MQKTYPLDQQDLCFVFCVCRFVFLLTICTYYFTIREFNIILTRIWLTNFEKIIDIFAMFDNIY